MYGTGTKKMFNMLILDILREYSDEDHRLTQQDVINFLKINYGMECERRAVKSNIDSLIELGYDIASDKGYYLRTREFSESELRLLIDSVFSSKSVSDREAHDITKKLEKFGSKYFKSHVSHVHSISSMNHTDNKESLKSIAAVDEAIARNRKISFIYMEYGIDKKMHPKRNMRYIVNPYQMVSNNGKYYLIGNYDFYSNIANFRLDRMTDVQILSEKRTPMKEIDGLENGLDIQKYMAEHVYMFSGESIFIKMQISEDLIGNVVDSFGKNFRITDVKDWKVQISLTCNPDAFFYWAMQYGLYVEVLEPVSMRERIRKACQEIAAKYSAAEKEEK